MTAQPTIQPTIRLTLAQALVRAMAAQQVEIDGERVAFFGGVWAIFGHGNVAALGEALYAQRGALPTLRAHNEQAMVHAALGYAKAHRRQRAMACTSSIGPGALNMVTAAAVAHVNRLPVLLLPGDVFAAHGPDPVLQQVEDFGDGTVSANDCFRPVSRYFDRLTRAEQLVTAFPRAMAVLTDPAACGPATLALCQDAQAEAFDYPASLFAPRVWRTTRPRPDRLALDAAASLLRGAVRPFIVVGGGALYSRAEAALADFCARRGVPAAETQAGKSALPASQPTNLGGLGVSGTAAANAIAAEADVILAVGTRLADFTTGSRTLFQDPDLRLIGLNTQPFDARKHDAQPLACDALAGLAELDAALADWRAPAAWSTRAIEARTAWLDRAAAFVDWPQEGGLQEGGPQEGGPQAGGLPSDAQVIGVVQRAARASDVVVCAAGGLPGELHKHWLAAQPGGYHAEYGFSCMGYEIAGALGVKLADPSREVIVMLGDGSYLMLNSEIATSIMLDRKLVIVLLDNRGFGCIHRLQQRVGSVRFNNLLADTDHQVLPEIDFAGHARSLGAQAETLANLAELPAALERARLAARTALVVIRTDASATTEAGGHWWDVAVPEVSALASVQAAREDYVTLRERRR